MSKGRNDKGENHMYLLGGCWSFWEILSVHDLVSIVNSATIISNILIGSLSIFYIFFFIVLYDVTIYCLSVFIVVLEDHHCG